MRPTVDSHYSWIQVISSFIYHVVFIGVSFSFGIFYVELLDEFPGRESEAAWITSINFAFLMLLGPLSVRVLERIPVQIVSFVGSILGGAGLYLSSKATDIWTLFGTFSVMHGIGTHLCYISSIWIIRRNFYMKKDVALGVASAGSGAGGVLFGVMLPALIQSNGWRMSMQVLSYISFATVILSFSMIPAEKESQVNTERTVEYGQFCESAIRPNLNKTPSPLRNPAFLVLSVSIMINTFVSNIPYCHIVNYAVQRGVNRREGDYLPLFISAGSLVGRFGLGRLVGFFGLTRLRLGQLVFFFQSLVTTFLTLANTAPSLVAISVLFGIFDGAFCCLILIVSDDVFEDNKKALYAMGHLFWMLAFPYAFGAPISAILYNETGSYNVPFFICGGVLFIASLLVSLVEYILELQNTKMTHNVQEKKILFANH